jgi:ketosteroid isomerase-like protein
VNVRDEILALEASRTEAMVRQDIAALTALLADNLSYTHSDGRTDTKQSFLDLVAAPALRYLGIEYTNQEVVEGGDAVIVRGRARMKLLRDPGGRQEYLVSFLDVWVRSGGRWQMAAWQATRVP